MINAKSAVKGYINTGISKFLYFWPESFEVPNSSRSPILSSGLKAALVKQDVYTNLYCAPNSSSFTDLIGSSLRHTGPAALFKLFDCDFHIVETEKDDECNIWRQKICDCQQGDIDYYMRQKKREAPYPKGRNWVQGELAIPSDSIDWNQYDIVISIDISIPEHIRKRNSKPLWCYYISEPCMRSYGASKIGPIAGYDVFLNQRFSPRLLGANSAHEIDFPFAFQYHGLFDEFSTLEGVRSGTFVEAHTMSLLSKSQLKELEFFGPIRTTSQATADIIKSLNSSKYFLRLGGRRLWGNSMVEAVACGALAIGNPGEYKNRSLFSNATKALTFNQCLDRISHFESHPSRYQEVLIDQTKRLNYYCYEKPANDLMGIFSSKKNLENG